MNIYNINYKMCVRVRARARASATNYIIVL